MGVGKLLLSPFGRIDRTTFWAAWLVVTAIVFALGWIPLFGWALSILALYVHVCLYSKRLHDMGRSAWWQVIPIIALPTLVLGGLVTLSGAQLIAIGDDRLAVRGGLGGEPLVAAVLLALVIGPAFFLWIALTPSRDPVQAGRLQGV